MPRLVERTGGSSKEAIIGGGRGEDQFASELNFVVGTNMSNDGGGKSIIEFSKSAGFRRDNEAENSTSQD